MTDERHPFYHYVLSLGSNLGNRETYLAQAVTDLLTPPGSLLMASSILYETAPWTTADHATYEAESQPWYLNAAIAIKSPLEPQLLLEVCQKAERDAGRPPETDRSPNASRSLDVDILWCDEVPILETPALTLPHPRFHLRACTLVPLLEHWADWEHPLNQLTLLEHHLGLSNPEPVRLFARPPWG